MRSLKTLIAAAAITALGIGVPAVLASTASAAVTPNAMGFRCLGVSVGFSFW